MDLTSMSNLDTDQIQSMVKIFNQKKETGAVNVPPELGGMLNEVGTMLDTLKSQKQLFCDKECQESQALEQAYFKYLDAKNQFESAPKQLEEREEAYFVLRDGPIAYMKQKEKNYTQEAKKMANISKEKLNEMVHFIQTDVNTITLQKQYIKNSEELLNKIMNSMKSIQKKMNIQNNDKNIANRKSDYYNELTTKYSEINSFLYYLVSVCIAIYILIVVLGGVLFQRKYLIHVILFSMYFIIPWNTLYLYLVQKMYEYTSFFR